MNRKNFVSPLAVIQWIDPKLKLLTFKILFLRLLLIRRLFKLSKVIPIKIGKKKCFGRALLCLIPLNGGHPPIPPPSKKIKETGFDSITGGAVQPEYPIPLWKVADSLTRLISPTSAPSSVC